jgi:hypothetical protein
MLSCYQGLALSHQHAEINCEEAARYMLLSRAPKKLGNGTHGINMGGINKHGDERHGNDTYGNDTQNAQLICTSLDLV